MRPAANPRQRAQPLRAIYPLTRLTGIVVSCVMACASLSKVVSVGLSLIVVETPMQKGSLWVFRHRCTSLSEEGTSDHRPGV
jgi:hypothetical protein